MVIKSSVDVVFKEPESIQKIEEIIFSSNALSENEYIEITGNINIQQLEYFLKEKAWYLRVEHISPYINLKMYKLELEGRRYYIYYNYTKDNIIVLRKDYYSEINDRDFYDVQKYFNIIKDKIRKVLAIPYREETCTHVLGDWGLFINCYIDKINVKGTLQWKEGNVNVIDIELPFYYRDYGEGLLRGALIFIHITDILDFFEKLIKKYFNKKEI